MEGANHGSDLVGVHDRTVELRGGVDSWLVLDFPAARAGLPLPLLNELLGLDGFAALRDFRVDQVDLVADVDLVRHSLFVGVFADDILLKEPVGAVVRRGGEADQEGIEILDDLAPQVVDRAVALIDDDHVEIFGRERGVVDDRQGFPAVRWPFLGMLLFRAFREFLPFERRVHALDRGDDDLHIAGDGRRLQALNVVDLGELAIVVVWDEGHELLFGLLAQVAGVDQK